MNWNKTGERCDRGHLRGRAAAATAVLWLIALPLTAQGVDGLSLGLDRLVLADVENAPGAESESTIVEIPAPITLRAPEDGRIGIRLRLSVFFSWNNVRFIDVGEEDIAASLRTLTVVPGLELMIPVGERWMVRPYGQFGGLNALNLSGHRWLASVGTRAGGRWSFERWALMAGGRFEYAVVLDEDFDRTDGVTFADVGADFSFPLWFDVKGERAAAGVFVTARSYLDRADLVGQDGFDLGVGGHIEIGASFQIVEKPAVWFVRLPSWYGIGGRFAKNHRSIRIYFGFPF